MDHEKVRAIVDWTSPKEFLRLEFFIVCLVFIGC